MNDEPPPLVRADAAALEASEERSLIDDVRQLAKDGKTLIDAELVYHKSRVAVAGNGIRGVAVWSALTAALVFFTLMALVLGALLGLGSLIGLWLATLVVVSVLLLIALIAGLKARARWKGVSAVLSDKERGA